MFLGFLVHKLGYGVSEVGEYVIRHIEAVIVNKRVVVRGRHIVYIIFIIFSYNVRCYRVVVAHKRFEHRIDVNFVFEPRYFYLLVFRRVHQKFHIDRSHRNFQRIARQHIVFHIRDITAHACRNGKYHRDADNSDTAGKRDHSRTLDFGQEIFERKHKCHTDGHRRFFLSALIGLRLILLRRLRRLGDFVLLGIRHSVADDFAVQKADYARGILLGKFGIVRDHYDEPVFGNLFQKLHYLNARDRIERARRFVRENYFGVVYKRAGYRHPLRLTARKLVRLIVYPVFQPDFFKRFFGASAPLFLAHARYGEGELHVLKHRLMRNQMIALKNKAYRMVSVCVPVLVAELFCADAVDNKIARSVLIKSSDYIQKRSFSAARRA